MNSRERILAFGVLTVVVLAGAAFLVNTLILSPLRERKETLVRMQQDIDNKQDRVNQIEADRPKLARWRQMTLPPDINLSKREYEKYLSGLLETSKFPRGSYSVTPKQVDEKTSPTIPGKGPIYTKLSFTIISHGKLENLVDFLHEFYTTGLLHQVKNLSIVRPLTVNNANQNREQLDINMTVEALILKNADPRNELLPVFSRKLVVIDTFATMMSHGGLPAAFAHVPNILSPFGEFGPGKLAKPERDYAEISKKDIFMGVTVAMGRPAGPYDYVPPERFIHLTDISKNDRKHEAILYDRFSDRMQRLRAVNGKPDSSFNSFTFDPIVRGSNPIRGKLVRMEDRDIIIQVGERYFKLHVGESLEQAMRTPLTGEQRKELGIASAPAKEPAEEDDN